MSAVSDKPGWNLNYDGPEVENDARNSTSLSIKDQNKGLGIDRYKKIGSNFQRHFHRVISMGVDHAIRGSLSDSRVKTP